MKPIARSVAILVALGAAVAAALWLLRERVAGPPIDPVRSHDDAPRIRTTPDVPAPVTDAADPDDLAAVNGIGPVYKRRLAAAGITTFAALAAADAQAVAEAAEAPLSFAEDWIGQAATLTDG